jgi:3-phenylpropionate/trans-cinnamate dioxygenase ferredoxin reductase component
MTSTVLIAGAGLAGSRCAESLRAFGWSGRIVLAGDEPHAPYERPALSKDFLAGTRDDVELRPRAFWAEQEIELLLGRPVADIDPVGRTASVGGELVHWDTFVNATGVRARRLAGPAGVHHLRSLDDARALAAELTPGTRAVVVGAGFVGGEVASTIAPFVGSVTVIEPLATPLERVLGPEVGGLLASRYKAHGVDLRLGIGVQSFDGGDRVREVLLSDGTTIPADVVVVGIGTVGETIEVDACGRASTPGVYACGDIASWWRPSQGKHVRVEHWTSAAGQARAVASAIAGEDAPYDEAPYFWSDQFGLRLQHVGHAETWHTVVLEGVEDAFTARYVDTDGRLLSALAANRAAELRAFRQELAA